MKHISKLCKEIKIGILIIAAIILTISASIFISKALYEENGKEIHPEISSNLNLIKYVNYKENGQEKSIVEFNLKEKITYDNDYYSPVNENSIYVKIPEIQGNLPEKVEVISISSKATNGDDIQKQAKYEYNPENRNLYIYEKNEANEDGSTYYGDSNDYDEYEIILSYDNKIEISDETNKLLNIPVLVRYDSTNEQIGYMQKIFPNEIELKEKGERISTEISTSQIYNGYINSNITNGTDYETEFSQETTIYVSELSSEEIILKEQNGFRNADNQVKQSNDITYKQIKINKQDIIQILGEDGFLQILDEEGNILAEINKEYYLKNQEVIFNFQEKNSSFIIKTSKPINKGIIRISTVKSINSEMKDLNNKYVVTAQEITGNQIQEKNEILNEEALKSETKEDEINTIIKKITTNEAEIKNATTKVNVTLDNKEWTSNIQNDVNIVATLMTSKNDCNLFKNPIIEIELPNVVEKVIIRDSYLLNANGLSIKNVNVVDKENGKKAIIAEIQGSQTEYLFDNMIDGTNVVIPATIILQKEFNSFSDNLNIKFNNEVGNSIESGSEQISVNLQSIIDTKEEPKAEQQDMAYSQVVGSNIPVEQLKENNALTVDVEAEVGDGIVSKSGTNEANNIQNGIVYERQVIKYKVTLTNNTENTISNISVNGEIPDYTSYATLEQGKRWSEEAGDYVYNIQDDLIYRYITDESVENYQLNKINTLNPGETKTDWYEVVVKDLEDGVESSNILNNIIVNIDDEEYDTFSLNNKLYQAKVEVKFKSQATSTEDQFMYRIEVTNLTNADLNNIYVETTDIPKELRYDSSIVLYSENVSDNGKIEDNKFKINLDEIEANKTKYIQITFTGVNYEENVNEIPMEMTAKAVVEDITYKSNKNRIKAYPQYVTAVMSLDKEGQKVKFEDELTYTVTVKNESKVKSFINIVNSIPEGIDGIEATYSYYDVGEDKTTNYDVEKEANTQYELIDETIDLSVKTEGRDDIYIPTVLPAGKSLTITIKAKAGYLDKSAEISNFVTVTGRAIETKVSNIVKVNVLTDVDWDHLTDLDKEEVDPADPDPEDPDPEDPDPEDPDPEDPDPEDPDPDDPDPDDPNPDDPDPDDPNPDDPNPDNPNPDNPNPDNPDPENPTQGKYSISGITWLDENADGRRIDSEKRLNGITVKLFNAETNSLVVIDNSRMNLQVNENGEYEFKNIPKGRYYCLFEYNTENYEITAYQKSGINSSVNNDASSAEVNIDGIVKNVGLTDVLVVDNNNLTNIDLGLVEGKKFDLKLEKNISKVTVNSSKYNKEYTYDNTSLAKVEIPLKNMEGAIVTIEYNLVITNEGNIAGYVNEITDYLPEGLIFEQTQNQGWSNGSDGYLKNSTLTSTRINPGETKTLKLYLTKIMSKGSTGLTKNSAEITKSSNSKNLKDIDSTAGNKVAEEDDYDSADILISVSTGVYRNTLIIILIIGGLVALIKVIKKYNKKLPTALMMILAVMLIGTSISYGEWYENITWVTDGGILSNGWLCTAHGLHQCAVGSHKYYCYELSSDVSNPSRKILKDVTLTKKSTSKQFSYLNSSYNLVGPYEVTCNYDIKSADITATVAGSGSYTICDSKGNIINWTRGKEFTFYIRVPKTVTAVTSVKVDVTVEDVMEVSQTVTSSYAAYCVSVGPYHENGSGEPVSPVPGGCQTVAKRGSYLTTTNEDGIKSVSWKAVYAGSLVIRKYDAERKNSSGDDYQLSSGCGALFSVEDSKGHIVATGVKPKQKITGLPPDIYTVTETSAPKGYNLQLQGEESKTTTTKSANVKGGTSEPAIEEFKFYNQKYTNILIQKVDSSNKDSVIEGIGFTIYDNKHQQYINASGKQTNTKTILYTDKDGKISINNIKLYDTSKESTFTITEADSKNPYYKVDTSKTKTVIGKSNATTEYVLASITNTKTYKMIINKKDQYLNAPVNAIFNIQYEDGTWLTSEGTYQQTKSNIQTPNGKAEIKGIKRGTYHIYEVGIATEKYKIEMQENYDSINKWVDLGTVVVNDDSTEPSRTFYNRRFTNIEINKKDNETKEAIEGMGFTVYDNFKKQYINALGEHINQPYIHYTDKEGKIKIPNIIVYDGNTTYTIKEVESKNLYYKADTSVEKSLSWEPKGTANWVYMDIENTKSYSLTVEKKDPDRPSENLRADFYIQYEDGTWLTEEGKYSQTPSSITINQNLKISKIKRGRYHIYEYRTPEGYDITQQEGYGNDRAHSNWVDCGIAYVGIDTSGNQNNEICEITLAKENKKYISKITGCVWVDNSHGKANEFDYVYGSEDEKLSGVKVEFINKDGTVIKTTTTNGDGIYTFEFSKQILYWNLQNYMVRFTYDNTNYTTVPVDLDVSKTNASRAMENHDWQSDYLATGTGLAVTIPNATRIEDSIAKYYNKSNYCIETINLGLIKKPGEEFSIIENIDYVQLKKGRYTFKYEYGKDAVIQNVPEREYIYDTVALQNSSRSFTQKLYPSDIAYNNTVTDDKFEVYVVYKISITNLMNININDLYVEKSLNITSLTNTYNSDIYEISDNNWQNIEADKAQYNNEVEAIAPSGTADISIQFKVTETGLQELIQGAKNNPDIYKEAITVATADGYHKYDRNDYSWTYPSNAYTQRNEHRTKGQTVQSGALSLILKLSEQRTISGKVFEDKQTTQSRDEGTRLGNGINDDDENNLKAVNVALLNKDETIASLYNTEGEYLKQNEDGIWVFEKQEGKVDVKDDGTYELKGVIPGEYYLRFTYNNGTNIVTDTSGTPIEISKYKSTILAESIANNSSDDWYIDVMGGRNSIATDKYYIDKDGIASNVIEMRTTSTEEINYASTKSFNDGSIQSLSNAMNIQFEYVKGESQDYDYNFNNNCSGMCFGIIERPHVEIKLSKEISNVKLILSNGTTIINGNPKDKNVSEALTSMNDSYAKIEIDNNYLHGSTASVTYNLTATNDSEIDYATERYYKTGEKENSQPVTTTVTKIIDYVSGGNNKYDERSGNIIEFLDNSNQYKNYFDPNPDIKSNNQKYKSKLLATQEENLTPTRVGTGTSQSNYTLTVTSLLSNLDDNLGWESYSEIIGLKNGTYTSQYTSHSGNYKAGDTKTTPNTTSEEDDAQAVIAITPSTGEDRSYIKYIIGGIVLITLAGGIIIIKKKV